MMLLHAPFEVQARRSPAAPALLSDRETWSYQRLDLASDRLAHHLIRRGVGPDVPVALVMERSPATVASILAVLKAGGAYVPVDPASPDERLAFVLTDCGAPLALARGEALERVARCGIAAVDPVEGLEGGEDAGAPAVDLDPGNLAYLIYTSGSTGRPKAVAMSHGAIANHMAWMARALPLEPGDVLLQKTALTFDASVSELFAPLDAGASMLLPPPGVEKEPHRLVQVLARGAVTVVQVVPSLLRLMLDEPGVDRLPALRRLLCGGEPLEPDLLARAAALLGVEIVNLYGPTETAVEVAWWRAAPGETADPVPVGRPVDGVALELRDPGLGPVAAGEPGEPGEVGEITVTGAALARGYHRRPGLTADRFRPAPEGPAGARTYRTGDLGRWSPAGELLCLGRRDGQVKLHGLRVELGEIEALLRRHPGVAQAAVDLREDVPGHRQLVAYLVFREAEQGPGAAELRLHLARHLPEALVPSSFVELPALPYSAHGKLDRRALPAVRGGRPDLSTDYQEPRGALEREVARRMGELLGGLPVGRHDDLFELGGNSLLAMRLLAGLRRELGRQASLGELLAEPTPVGLARRLGSGTVGPTEAEDGLPAVRPRPDAGPRAPVAPSQERVLFVQGLAPGMLAYQFQNAIHFRGRLDPEALAASLDDVCRRHEVYRTTFELDGERWVQHVHPPRPAALTVVDLVAELPEASVERRRREAAERIRAEVRHRFDPARLPLVRWVLYSLGGEPGDGRWVMLHHEHHLIHDGWAYNLFLEELLVTYRARVAGEACPLPVPEVQYADFAVLQQEWLGGEGAARQLAWWRRHLDPLPPALDLPYDRARPAEPRFRGFTLTRELPAALCDGLRGLARQAGGTPFMVLLAGFLTLLHRYSGQSDLAVGSAVANRRWPGCEGLYGMLVDNVVLRADLAGDPTFRSLVDRVRGEALAVWERQELPFDRVVREVAPVRDSGVNPLFQVMFSFHDAPLPELSAPGLSLELDEGVSNGSAKFDMNIVAIPRLEQRAGWRGGADSRRITLIWEADRDLFDVTTVERAFRHLGHLLRAAVADPDRALSRLPLMGAAERQQVAAEWAGPPPTPLPDSPVHRRVLERAARTPDAPAVEGGGEGWTYGELAHRVRGLATVLAERGVGPDVPVGIALPRGPEMVAAMLAVLAAGGAYLPLDPAFPDERLRFMVEDAGLRWVITRPGLLPDAVLAGRETVAPDAGAADPTVSLPPPEAGPEALAYVLYTSGSTGRPKGVEVPHRALTNFLDAMAREPGLGGHAVVLAVTTLSFDISVLELLLPLVTGARVVVAGAEDAADGRRLADLLARSGATHLQATPATWRMLLDAGWDGDPALTALCGGEALPVELAATLGPRVAALWNLYGPTETTVWSAARAVDPGEDPVRVGGVIANTRIDLEDRAGGPVPVGGVGEILIGGLGVTRGYRNRPALTADRFVPDPAGPPGARRYRTGDLARRRTDGTLTFLGRSDGQVKVRGFRIEVGEVEAALRGLPGVADAAVAVRGDGADRRLVAGYVAAAGSSPAADELRSGLLRRLPTYMIPAAFVALEAIPLTPNGKVDRRSLPDPGDGAAPAERTAPRNELEELLVEEWQDLLERDGIGVTESFFTLGGHSLLATRLLHRLRALLGVDVAVRTLYRAPTIEGLAREIEDRLVAEELAAEGIDPAEEAGPRAGLRSAG